MFEMQLYTSASLEIKRRLGWSDKPPNISENETGKDKITRWQTKIMLSLWPQRQMFSEYFVDQNEQRTC